MSSEVITNPQSRFALVQAYDEERDAYRRMRQAIPDLSKPAAERRPVSATQRDLISRWNHTIECMRKLQGA